MRAAIATWIRGALETAGTRYGVDPRIWFAIAVASAPPFYFFLFRGVRSLARGDRSRALGWAGVCLFLYLSPWYYVLLFGHDLPWWVFVVMAAFAGWCVVALARKLMKGRGSERRGCGAHQTGPRHD